MVQTYHALESSLPVPYDSALLLKALLPGISAAFIANAARGHATLEDLAEIHHLLLNASDELAAGR